MKRLILPVFLLLIAACSSPEGSNENQNGYFFDLKGYFQTEAARMTAMNKPVTKVIVRNNSTESKRVLIDWNQELELFSASDINKASWKDSYQTKKNGGTTTYMAIDEKLRTQKVVLVKGQDGRVEHIQINNRTKNYLYTSSEKLDYFPDSCYTIEKSQSVRVIGNTHFIIRTTVK